MDSGDSGAPPPPGKPPGGPRGTARRSRPGAGGRRGPTTGPRLAETPPPAAAGKPKPSPPAGRRGRAGGAEAAAADADPWLLVAGDAFEDLIFAGLPRLPRPGEEVRTTAFTRTVGGGAVISAAWSRAERLRVRLLSALPPGVGPFLGTQGIECRDLRRTDEHHAVTAALSFGEERSFATFAPEIPGSADRLREALGAELSEFAGQPTFGALLLALLPSDPPAWARWVERAKRGEARPEIFWDFGYDLELARRPGFPDLVQAADGVFVNRREADLYRSPLRRAAKSGTLVVVKLGAKGAEVLDRPETRVPAPLPLRGVLDTTGAGDAFNAGFLARRLRGGSLGEQIAAGNALGAQCVQRVGGLPAAPWGQRPARRPSLFDGEAGDTGPGAQFRKRRRKRAAGEEDGDGDGNGDGGRDETGAEGGDAPRLRPVGRGAPEADAGAGGDDSGGDGVGGRGSGGEGSGEDGSEERPEAEAPTPAGEAGGGPPEPEPES